MSSSFNDGLNEYIAVYVDDMLIAARNPNEIVKVCKENHKLKQKVLVHLLIILVEILPR
jgi:hypothetical protein